MAIDEQIKVFNSLSGQLEVFEPLTPGQVTMYVCGVTVYDECHVGHARVYIVFDVIRRYFEYCGYRVTHIQNFTDIDDKIIDRASEEEKSFSDIATKYTEKYFEVMDRLNIRRADFYPTVSGHINEIIEFVRDLIEKGYAYRVEGDVFFSIEKFEDYGKLSGQDIEEMREGSRVAVDTRKKSPLDFALWKSSPADQPGWDSPWGRGRPGWHIECSVMSQCHLGETLDIHGGGRDLIFPHHENELAQSEAHSDHPLARYWLHNGFVTIDQEKMSKSLGNFFTLRELYEKYSPQVIRYFILSRHYRSPINFSFDRLEEAAAALAGLRNLYKRLKIAESWSGGSEIREQKTPELQDAIDEFKKAMNSDFNTAAALGVLQKWAGEWNSLLSELEKQDKLHRKTQQAISFARGWLQESCEQILGLSLQDDDGSKTSDVESRLVELLLQIRKRARDEGNYSLGDQIRDSLQQLGIEIQDTPKGTRWEWLSE
ncbi:MAG: cysteine--tRNA ligase [bacterium]